MKSMNLFCLLTLFVPVLTFAKPHWSQAILADVQNLYNPFVKAQSETLEISFYESANSEVASAATDGTHHTLTISKNLLLNPQLTLDGYRIILCHELGHIFGGAPRKNLPIDWDGPISKDGLMFESSEGQADFYATATCFRKIVNGQNHKIILSKLKVDPWLVKTCDQIWGVKTQKSEVCQRAALGAENFLKLYRDFDISFQKADENVVNKLLRDEYPSRQCRLDTFLRGALCKSHEQLKFNFSNQVLNECNNSEGKRPRCWYSPQ